MSGRVAKKCIAKSCNKHTFNLFKGICDSCQAEIDKEFTEEKGDEEE
jgi:hypothetical protein